MGGLSRSQDNVLTTAVEPTSPIYKPGQLAADAEDVAIIEGYAALDPRVEGIAVYATSATTKRLQAAKRAATP